MSLRMALLALGLTPLVAGCAAGGRMSIRPDVTPERPTTPIATVGSIVDRINSNAAPVSGLTASTTVSMQDSRFGGGVSGQLSMERPRNFKLALERGFGTRVADVGSNDEEFWIWTKDSEEKALYVGQYDARGSVPPDLMFQPEWIVEALGLREISPEEERRIKVERGREPQALVLTHYRDDGYGKTLVKRTVLDAVTQQPRQHVFYALDSKVPIAVVTTSGYRQFPVESETGSYEQTVRLPEQIQLKLSPSADPKDHVVMEIGLRNVRLNPEFTETNRQALFQVPEYDGYRVVRLNDERRGYAAGGTRSYQSRPAPRTGREIRLEEPAPLDAEGTALRRTDPMPLEADLAVRAPKPLAVDRIARTGIPTAPE